MFTFSLNELVTLIKSCSGNFLDDLPVESADGILVPEASNIINNEKSSAVVTFVYKSPINIAFGNSVLLVGSTYAIVVSLTDSTKAGIFVNFDTVIFTNHDCLELNVSYTYNEVGSFTAEVFVWTPDGNKTERQDIQVVDKYKGVTIGINETVIEPSEKAVIYVDIASTASRNMGNLSITISPCGQTERVEAVTIGPGEMQQFLCSFPTQGNYSVKIDIQSPFRVEDSIINNIYVWDRLNVSLKVDDTSFTVGSNPTFEVVGLPTFGFRYYIDFGEQTVIEESDLEVYKQRYSGISLPTSLNYTTPGTYYISFKAYNDFYTVIQEICVTASYGFPDSYLVVNPSRDLIIPYDGLVQFDIFSTSELSNPLQLNATCDIVYGDGMDEHTLIQFEYNISGFGLRLEHTYTSAGTHNMTFNCSNPVSVLVLTATIKAIKINVNSFNLSYRRVNLHNESQSGLLEVELPLYDLKTPPSGVELEWDFGDDHLTGLYTMTNFSQQHTFAMRGKYEVTLKIVYDAKTRVHHLPITMGAFKISLLSPEPYGLLSVTEFSFKVVNNLLGTSADVNVTWGDGHSTAITLAAKETKTVNYTFTSAGNFKPKIQAETAIGSEFSFLNNSIFIDTPVQGLTWNIPASVVLGGTFSAEVTYTGSMVLDNITCVFDYDGVTSKRDNVIFLHQSSKLVGPDHIFTVMGEKEISINCSNQLSYQVLSQKIIVLSGCFSVARMFEEKYRNISTPLRAYTSQIPIISERIDILSKCQNSTKRTFEWSIEEQGTLGWRKLNVASPNAKVFDLAMCQLIPGLYRLSCRLTVYGSKVESIKDMMYLKLIDPPLFAEIAGGIQLTVKQNADFSLDAKSYSFDPVIGYGKESSLGYTWRCFAVLEGDLDRYLTPEIENTSYKNGAACSLSLPAAGVVTVSASLLQSNAWVLFEVVISKGVRTATSLQAVHVVADDTPTVFLE